jgi:hypothetical protein
VPICRTQTALAKLALLRQRVKRYPSLTRRLNKLHSPNLGKALTFLDDQLLPPTSNGSWPCILRIIERNLSVILIEREQNSLSSGAGRTVPGWVLFPACEHTGFSSSTGHNLTNKAVNRCQAAGAVLR